MSSVSFYCIDWPSLYFTFDVVGSLIIESRCVYIIYNINFSSQCLDPKIVTECGRDYNFEKIS